MGEHGSKKCVVCGEKTEQVATVYLGHEQRSKGGRISMDYRTIKKPVCESCARSRHDKDPLRWLFPLVLQLGWFELVRAGHTFLGYMGVLFAVYGLYRLVVNIGDLLWSRLRPDQEEPAWLSGGETMEDMASECLKAHLKGDYRGTSEHLETIREYERRHANVTR